MAEEIINPDYQPPLYAWYHNDVHMAFRELYRADDANRKVLEKVIDDLRDNDENTRFKDIPKRLKLIERMSFMGLLARVYAAGTLQHHDIIVSGYRV